ncbi:hypothetical protein CONCODRAFT_10512 [Conidiobolus coronatus NRRL 28638]|uniref:F-box domain-containing protein n=1 Tax=Conidiobolus coronatus (strain ATCC 28846 / CBS 209.66 / NRRL 28638) TaxID=796925 RepID=A0A137NX66_CONC2|nr:hypothetical protein CONCODRAFT_10512 [Conidiobolus coronatus NRRL 28638]|eukprot:KXN67430.1 hypothetical protein CONCODRAFT_10512 [Conidiobolus coronatus NRRL 28638]
MTRVLRSTTKKIQSKVDLSSKLSISKKAKTIKRTGKKAVEVKKKDNRQSNIWNINTLLSNIFAYTDHKDLVEFSTVCKKWNNITNPIIHKTIKLNRSWDILNQVHDKRLKNHSKIGADVIECISNNAKHAHLVKELNFDHSLKPQRAIEVFETFKFINKLTVESCEISQDQFIGMVSPLTQLQELTLCGLDIKRIIYKRLYKEAAQLPSSLNKLSLSVRLIDNPDLFIRTINSHRNLVEFRCSNSNYIFLEPFYKSYKNLLKFEYLNDQLQSPESLIKVFEQNQQLISLKLNLKFWSSELTSYISSQLINLEELSLTEYGYYYQDYTNIFLKFSQPTKIKKLNLEWLRMSNCSLDSILLNCPQLEELALNRINSCQQPNTEILINLCKSAKIKKLSIDFQNLKGPILETLLSSCYHLNELKWIPF